MYKNRRKSFKLTLMKKKSAKIDQLNSKPNIFVIIGMISFVFNRYPRCHWIFLFFLSLWKCTIYWSKINQCKTHWQITGTISQKKKKKKYNVFSLPVNINIKFCINVRQIDVNKRMQLTFIYRKYITLYQRI